MISLCKRIFLFSFLILSFGNRVESSNNSPYSYYGLGDGKNQPFSYSASMGGISAALATPFNLNVYNPASYNALELTTFETGLSANMRRMYGQDSTQTVGNIRFAQLAIGFPVSKRMGASFGLIPLSWKDYSSEITETLPGIGTYTRKLSGTGGYSQFYIGGGYQITKNLSIGLNVNYLFGAIKDQKITEFPDSSDNYNSRESITTTLGDVLFNTGLQYQMKLKDDVKFTIGLSESISNKINSTRFKVAERYEYSTQGFIFIQDTIAVDEASKVVEEKGEITLPHRGTLGFTLEKSNKYLIGLEIGVAQWSKYTYFGQTGLLQDSWNVAIGGKYTPDYNAVGNYWKLVSYRAGLRYAQTELLINNTPITEYGISFGITLPMVKTRSTINCGFELSSRGTKDNGLIKENMAKLYLGFTLNDKWFVRRKIE